MKAPERPDHRPYRGRLAPTPSGWLHLGHAVTFGVAWRRARERGGTLVYRTEDLDPGRCKPRYAKAAMEDLRWWGLDWDEGPDRPGSHQPYIQSQRLNLYKSALQSLQSGSLIYPSPHSRREIAAAQPAASPINHEPIFPPSLRPSGPCGPSQPSGPWRFRVPDGREIRFMDGRSGEQTFVAGRDFGDFLVWRRDGIPSYELAVVVDDHAMEITEVVRGEDLLLSTARQLLLYEALAWEPPAWYHCELVIDPGTGRRMSKTHRSMGLRALRAAGHPPGRSPAFYFTLAD